MGCYYPQTVFIYFPTMMPIRMNFPRVSVLDKSIKILGGRAASDQEPNHFTNTTWWRGICQKLMLLFQRRKKENYYIVTGRQDDRPTTDGHQFPQASRLTTTPLPLKILLQIFFWGVSKQASKPFKIKEV